MTCLISTPLSRHVTVPVVETVCSGSQDLPKVTKLRGVGSGLPKLTLDYWSHDAHAQVKGKSEGSAVLQLSGGDFSKARTLKMGGRCGAQESAFLVSSALL